MKRRNFIRTGSAISLPVFINGVSLGYLAKSSFFNAINDDHDRVLVLIQLDGGNDGINTLIPLDQYANLAAVRLHLLIPENTVLPLYDHVGLHPVMSGLKSLFDNGKLLAIQNVAYPNQNRSHFRSMDIWQTGSASETYLTSGWLGRYFYNRYPEFPADYPNPEHPDPFAITIGMQVSETCQGQTANYSMAVTDPFSISPVDETTVTGLPDTNFGREMAYLIDMMRQTNAYAGSITEAAAKGNNLSTLYDDDNPLARQLKTVALLISGGMQTRVYVVRIGGFDTHANQVVQGGPATGQHATLLRYLSEAISAFQDDLEKLGLAQRVLGMTFSEFGRQIAANDSLGTDHGTAAPMFLFGSCVQGGIIGQNPVINSQLQPQEGVTMEYDYREVYASVLQEWFGVDEQEAASLLFGQWTLLPLVDGICTMATSVEEPGNSDETTFRVFPNPLNGKGTLSFYSRGERIHVGVHDMHGRRIRVIADRVFENGAHTITFETVHWPAGTYILRLQGRTWHQVQRVVKL